MLTREQFEAEIEECERLVRERCLAALSDIGMSTQGLRHVEAMEGYPRVPYHMVLWVLDDELRKELGQAVCTHAVGVKLLDDLFDADQQVPPRDLLLGVYLFQLATVTFASHRNHVEVLRELEEGQRKVWRHAFEEKSATPTTLDEWVVNARTKSGLMLSTYARVACLAAGAAESAAAAAAFGEAFAVLYTMGDDWMDYAGLNELEGNLAHMVASGQVSLEEFREAARHWRGAATEALTGASTACDLVPFIQKLAQKVWSFYWQVATSGTRPASGVSPQPGA
jgi:hypothetical protein